MKQNCHQYNGINVQFANRNFQYFPQMEKKLKLFSIFCQSATTKTEVTTLLVSKIILSSDFLLHGNSIKV